MKPTYRHQSPLHPVAAISAAAVATTAILGYVVALFDSGNAASLVLVERTPSIQQCDSAQRGTTPRQACLQAPSASQPAARVIAHQTEVPAPSSP